ncbi:MAG: hypothetical protein V3W41_14445 [Planctomycetota bacterium]
MQAEADLAATLEAPGDFGFPLVLTDPSGTQSPAAGQPGALSGQSADIGTRIDPDTGMPVSGRTSHVALRISSLVTAGFTDLPRAVADAGSDPWIVSFEDLAGNEQAWKVKSSMPDRTLGLVTAELEFWKTL